MDTTTISDIVATITAYAPDAEVAPVMQAYLLAARAHQGQFRKSGEAYLQHPIEVARILADMRMDVDTIATALLHDALEDNPITKEEMSAQVGPVITELVDGVTKIGKLRFRSQEELQAENFRKMMLAMSKDLRVILVKLADRLHNMRTLEGHNPEKRAKIARETLEIYAPIANRLGLNKLKSELEDLGFRYTEPEAYADILAYLDRTAEDRHTYIERVCVILREELDSVGVQGEVSGRAKEPMSIWRKMQNQGCTVAEVPDILAFRVLLPDLSGCYTMLGQVHARFPPVPGRFKDYIARPKPNGYKSLHTTVIGPSGKRIEVQMRTHAMHSVAEKGIAAHWRYKEGHLDLDPKAMDEVTRIREAFAQAAQTSDATELMETVKVAFYADEVFVFTPAGDVKVFPLGATPIDFAYAIHSDVGDQCVGARVDGRIVPLDYRLKSGDRVEILTKTGQRPRRDWLDIAKTSSAIYRIRRYLRRAEEQSALRVGREILEAELERVGWSLSKADKDGLVDGYLKHRSLKSIDGVFIELARGHRPASEVAQQMLPKGVWFSRQEEGNRNRITGLLNRFVRKSRSPVVIGGQDDLLVSYAGCCNPLPGEPVVGFITRGRGITVHRADCEQLQRLEEDRRIPVEWDAGDDTRHSNSLVIFCENKPGMLSAVTKICEKHAVNIERAEARATQGPVGQILLQVAVRDLAELQAVITKIQRIPEVQHVERSQG